MMNTPATEVRWLSEKEVARLTGFSTSTLQKHRFRHIGIPYLKVGRAVRYNLEDVIAYMQGCRVVPGPN